MNQAVELLEIPHHLLANGFVLDELRAQAKAGDGGAQIMAHGRKHGGALLHETLDPVAHEIEGARRLSHLFGAVLGQRRVIRS